MGEEMKNLDLGLELEPFDPYGAGKLVLSREEDEYKINVLMKGITIPESFKKEKQWE